MLVAASHICNRRPFAEHVAIAGQILWHTLRLPAVFAQRSAGEVAYGWASMTGWPLLGAGYLPTGNLILAGAFADRCFSSRLLTAIGVSIAAWNFLIETCFTATHGRQPEMLQDQDSRHRWTFSAEWKR